MDRKVKSPKVKKKRKITPKEESENITNKRQKKDVFTEIQFKFMMKDAGTSFIGLEKFVEQAKEYPESTSFDIVANYCRSSEECVEIFQLLEGKRKSVEACVIFETLELILMRIADDLVKYKAVARGILRKILASHMGLIYATLAMKNKSHHIKVALKLLTAMVLQGENEARDVQLQFNFRHSNIQPLGNRIDTKDKQDVRQCLIHFALSFLIAGDIHVIRQLIESRFLHIMFPGLVCDKMNTIEVVLSTLMEKVVKNPGLNKSTRILLFTERNLKHLAGLYNWKGPQKWIDQPKKKQANRESSVSEGDAENQNTVKNLVHQFLVEICCSVENGINFHDRTFATGKNMNHVLTNLLQSLQQPYISPLQTELVVKVLAVCPDLLHWYLPCLKHAVEPRASKTWLSGVQFITQIFEAQPKASPALSLNECIQPSKLVSMACNTLMPPREVWAEIVAAVKSPTKLVQFEGLQLMLVVMKRINLTINQCLEDSSEKSEKLREFVGLFREMLRKVLPDVGVWMSLWKSVVEEVSGSDSKDKDSADIQVGQHVEDNSQMSDLPKKKGIDVALPLLENLCAYQSAIPHDIQSQTMDFGILLQGVQVVADRLQDNRDVSLLWVYVLELLSGSHDAGIQWSKETKGGKTFLFVLLEALIYTKDNEKLNQQVKDLIVKMMKNTGIFDDNTEEIYLWLDELNNVDEGLVQTVLKFIEEVLLKLLKDPYTYTERVMEFMSEAASTDCHVSDTISVGTTSDALIDMILSMEPVKFGESTKQVDEVQSNTSLVFSPLAPCSLDILSSDSSTSVLSYVSRVLLCTLKSQTEPLAFCLLLYKYKELLCGQRVMQIGKYFLPEELQEENMELDSSAKKKNKKKKHSLGGKEAITLSFADKLEDVFCKSIEGVTVDTEELTRAMETEVCDLSIQQCGAVVSQCVLYITFYWQRYQEDVEKYLEFYTNLFIKVIKRLSPSEQNMEIEETPSDPDAENSRLKEKMLIFAAICLLKHSAVKRLLVAYLTSESKKKLTKKGHIDNVYKCSVFIMEVIQLLPGAVLSSLTEISSPYVSAINKLLKGKSLKTLSEDVVTVNILAFWKLLDRENTVEATSFLLSYYGKLHRSGQVLSQVVPTLVNMLQTIDEGKYEMHGNHFSVEAVRTLTRLTDTLLHNTLITPTCTVFLRHPPYCKHIDHSLFNVLIQSAIFGHTLLKKSPNDNMDEIVQDALVNGKKKPKLFELIVCWLKYSSDCRTVFEEWVKKHSKLFNIGGWSVWPVAKQYLTSANKLDKQAKDILVRHFFAKMEKAFTSNAAESCEEAANIIDGILPQFSTENVFSLTKLLSAVINGGKEHLTATHITIYKKLTDLNSKDDDQCIQALNNCLEGLLKVMTKKKNFSSEVQETLLSVINNFLVDLPKGPEFHSGIDLFSNEEKVVNFLKMGLKQHYNKNFLSIVEHIVISLIILGRVKCGSVFSGNELSDYTTSSKKKKKNNTGSIFDETMDSVNGTLNISYENESSSDSDSSTTGDENDSQDEIDISDIDLELSGSDNQVDDCSDNSSACSVEDSGDEQIEDENEEDDSSLDESDRSENDLDTSDNESDEGNSNCNNNNSRNHTRSSKQLQQGGDTSSEESEVLLESNSESDLEMESDLDSESKSDEEEMESESDEDVEVVMEESKNDEVNMKKKRKSLTKSKSESKEKGSVDISNLENESDLEESSEEDDDIGEVIMKVDEETKVLLVNIYNMVLSHSQFLPVILDEDHKCHHDKDALLDLLITIVNGCKSVCDTKHLAVFLGAYGAVLSSTDQKILKLIHLYEKNGMKMTQYRPYLWGKAAIDHYSVKKNLSQSLWKQPSMGQIVEGLDPAKLWRSVLYFPLRRTLVLDTVVYSTEELKSSDECYDPCFVLPVFFHMLAPENVVKCQKFVEHNCLSYVLAALSCHNDSLRGLAYAVLARFYHHLEASRFQEKEQLLNLLECVKNSIEQVNMKLACIVTIFLAKVAILMLKPDEHMYQMVNSFMLLKPNMDVFNVPEFYKLFNSSALEFKSERAWMLTLLEEGLRETADYRVFEKRFTFKLILSYYNSALSDQHTQKQVLKVVSRACSIKTVAFDLVKNHGLLSWIMSLVSSSHADKEVTMDVLHSLWFSMLDKRDQEASSDRKNPVLPLQFTKEFITVMLTCLRNFKSFSNTKNFYKFVETLESALRHQEKSKTYLQIHQGMVSCDVIKVDSCDVIYLFYHWAMMEMPDGQFVVSVQDLINLIHDWSYINTFENKLTKGQHVSSSSAFPFMSSEKLENLLKIPDTKKCIENLLEVVRRLNPLCGKLTSSSKVVASYVFVLHTSLQLASLVGKTSLSGCQSHLDWVQTILHKCDGLKDGLMNRQNDTLTSVREMINLLEYIL